MSSRAQNEMLHCKPSQIQLTSADVGELGDRIISRRRAFSDVAKGKARLSTGPRLPTIIAAAHAEDGIAPQQSSPVPLHPPPYPSEETTRRPRYNIPVREASAFALRPNFQQKDRLSPTLEVEPIKVDSTQASPSSSPPRLRLPSSEITSETCLRHRRRQTSPSHHAVGIFDGAHDSDNASFLKPPAATRLTTPTQADRQRFRESLGGLAANPSPHIDPHQTSDARARRSKSKSQEQVPPLIFEARPEHPSSAGPPQRTRPQRYHPPILLITGDLDPAAPAFTPRVRFGTTTVVPEQGTVSAETSETPSLRPRTESEQNAISRHDRRPETSAPAQDARPRRLRSNVVILPSRQSSENNAVPLPNLERYPRLLPTARNAFDHERHDSVQYESSRPQIHPAQLSSSSSVFGTSSPPTAPASRIPSIVSAASGISSRSISEDAAAEFLRFRSSPLDVLTAELSRLSTALGPAEVAGEKRTSLLNGNPFDVKSTAPQEDYGDADLSQDIIVTERDGRLPKLLASPSHLTLPTSPAIPSTPISRPDEWPMQRNTLPPHSTTRPAKLASKSTMPAHQAAAIATPRLPVYNDATPARHQPQTPADLHRSSRRTRNRSDSSVRRQACYVGQVLVGPRPLIPVRRAYRNTYPTNAPAGGVDPAAGSSSAGYQRGVSDEAENRVEGQLAGLESDRAVWARRRQGGNLDVTPPGQGRFERFLDRWVDYFG